MRTKNVIFSIITGLKKITRHEDLIYHEDLSRRKKINARPNKMQKEIFLKTAKPTGAFQSVETATRWTKVDSPRRDGN